MDPKTGEVREIRELSEEERKSWLIVPEGYEKAFKKRGRGMVNAETRCVAIKAARRKANKAARKARRKNR